MYQLILLTVFCASALAGGSIPLPPNFKVCSRSSPDFNKCLVPAISSAVADLVKGSRPLSVLPIDPLKLTSLGINQGSGSSVAVDLNFRDISIFGIRHVKVDSVDAQLNGDEKTLTVKVTTNDLLSLVGKYTINGKVLVLPISGDGNARIDLNGAEAIIALSGKLVEKDGVSYLVFNKLKFTLLPKTVAFKFENLFNGDKALGDNMNIFLNENWRPVFTDLRQSIETAFASTFIGITNQIFSKVSYDHIFPK